MSPGEFRKQVKHRLIDMNMSMSELENKVTEMTGLYCDNSYMSRIFHGKANAPKIVEAVKEILRLGYEL